MPADIIPLNMINGNHIKSGIVCLRLSGQITAAGAESSRPKTATERFGASAVSERRPIERRRLITCQFANSADRIACAI
jgi:hypothetical protein